MTNPQSRNVGLGLILSIALLLPALSPARADVKNVWIGVNGAT
jgi:hypothetical protein